MLSALRGRVCLHAQLLLLRQLFLPLFLGFDVLLLHHLDGFKVLLNVLVLAAFDRAVGLMNGVAKVLLEKRVDAQDRVLSP